MLMGLARIPNLPVKGKLVPCSASLRLPRSGKALAKSE